MRLYAILVFEAILYKYFTCPYDQRTATIYGAQCLLLKHIFFDSLPKLCNGEQNNLDLLFFDKNLLQINHFNQFFNEFGCSVIDYLYFFAL